MAFTQTLVFRLHTIFILNKLRSACELKWSKHKIYSDGRETVIDDERSSRPVSKSPLTSLSFFIDSCAAGRCCRRLESERSFISMFMYTARSFEWTSIFALCITLFLILLACRQYKYEYKQRKNKFGILMKSGVGKISLHNIVKPILCAQEWKRLFKALIYSVKIAMPHKSKQMHYVITMNNFCQALTYMYIVKVVHSQLRLYRWSGWRGIYTGRLYLNPFLHIDAFCRRRLYENMSLKTSNFSLLSTCF